MRIEKTKADTIVQADAAGMLGRRRGGRPPSAVSLLAWTSVTGQPQSAVATVVAPSVFIAAQLFWNRWLTVPPRTITTATMTAAIADTISAYSTAVAPESDAYEASTSGVGSIVFSPAVVEQSPCTRTPVNQARGPWLTGVHGRRAETTACRSLLRRSCR